MKTYHYTKSLRHEDAEVKGAAEQEPKAMMPEDPIARAAFEWNHALLLAATRMWQH